MDSTDSTFEDIKHYINEIWLLYYKLYVLRRGGVSLETLEAAISEATIPRYLSWWNNHNFVHFIEEELFYGIPRVLSDS